MYMPLCFHLFCYFSKYLELFLQFKIMFYATSHQRLHSTNSGGVRKPFINILNSFTIYINSYTVQKKLEDNKCVIRSINRRRTDNTRTNKTLHRKPKDWATPAGRELRDVKQ